MIGLSCRLWPVPGTNALVSNSKFTRIALQTLATIVSSEPHAFTACSWSPWTSSPSTSSSSKSTSGKAAGLSRQSSSSGAPTQHGQRPAALNSLKLVSNTMNVHGKQVNMQMLASSREAWK